MRRINLFSYGMMSLLKLFARVLVIVLAVSLFQQAHSAQAVPVRPPHFDRRAMPEALAAPVRSPKGDAAKPAPDWRFYVLEYHNFTENASQAADYTMTVSALRRDLDFLRDNGYTTVLPRELAAGQLDDGSPLPQKAVLLTFDDGYESNYTLAFPILREYGAKAAISLITSRIDERADGFLTWDDIYINKLNFKRYRMQSKIILMTTACLILFPVVFFFTCDLKNLSTGNRLLAAAFQSVTTRTAGFNTIDISKMSEPSKAVMILLMLIGGSPGSTAGGMKTTTFTVLVLNAIATFRSQENAGAFGRRLEYHVIKNAATIAMLYFVLFFCGGLAISIYEELPLLDCLYEAASAVGTVGLTLGITPVSYTHLTLPTKRIV